MMGKLVKLWMVLVLVVFLLGVVAPSFAQENPNPLTGEGNNSQPQVIVVGNDSGGWSELPNWLFFLVLAMFLLFGFSLYLSHNSYPPEFKLLVKDLMGEIQRRGTPLVKATATPLDDWALGMLGKLNLDDTFHALEDVTPDEARAAALDAISRLQLARSGG